MKNAVSDKPKILIISGSYPDIKCGIGDYAERLLEAFRSRHIPVSLLTSRDPLVMEKDYVYPLIKKWNIFSMAEIMAFIGKTRPAIINLQAPTIRYKAILSPISFLPALSKIFFNPIPFILTVHDYSISREFFKPLFLPIFLFSDIIIVTNEEDERDIVKHFPFLKRRIKRIHMGPTAEMASFREGRVKEFREKIKYEEADRYIATFGFIKKDRCVDKAIEVFRRLSEYDNKLKLLIIGDTQKDSDREYKESLFSLVERWGIKNKVCWLGFCDTEEAAFYSSVSDLSVLLYERGASFRRSSLINLVLRKVPVITNINKHSRAGNELISSGMVLASDSMDIDELYEKAKLVLYEKGYADNLRKKMAKAQEIFNWDRNVDEIIGAYSQLIKRRNNR